MKRIIGIVTFVILAFTITSKEIIQNESVCELRVEISKLKSNDGTIVVYLFSAFDQSSVEFYPKEEFSVKSLSSKIQNKTATVVFTNLPKGDYAYYIHHDENIDGKMNTNFIGMPIEGYCFSNTAKPGMNGLPNFYAAKIFLHKGINIIKQSLTY